MTRPFVTVVVCTYNRADFLKPSLDSLAAQQTGGKFDYEVLVVNNASTDGTRHVIDAACDRWGAVFRRVDEPSPGISFCRNRGIAEARGSWIAFFDDDQLADPQWLAKLIDSAQRQNVPCVAGSRELALPEGTQRVLAPFCRELLGEDCGGEAGGERYGKKRAPTTGNLLVERAVFDKIGAFNTALTSGEDSELYDRMRRAGIAVWYNPAALVWHVIPKHRLEDTYFLWASARNGWNRARRESSRFGWPGRVARLVARLAQAGIVFLPRLAFAMLRGDRERILECRCLLARTTGYVRGAAHWNAPGLFAQPAMNDRLEFRSERKQITQAPTP
jgi:glycosyltransferase involved in cell wall biosynthesis